ncbi:MAG: polysaccharide deacetylase family protein [Campylobacteraceae bacterium]|jgi:peptidoglycan/xylan/chitin deacetylase (PgdA/CDA1 family)|nr:polysaccharide deacetylase family protein [Campylobacteraceae bacterium]
MIRGFFLFCVFGCYLFADAHIFLYHRFDDARYPSTNTPNSALRKQFEFLKENNYTVVPLSAIADKLNQNETLPDKWVALTIDDGYRSFLNALPIFDEFGYAFTMFVYVEATEKKYPDFLTWEELKKLENHNGTLAFHSYSHSHQTKQSEKALREDFEKGLGLYEKMLGNKSAFYSYPYGEFNDEVQKIAKDFGFTAILNQNMGVISKASDVYDLPRFALTGSTNIKPLVKYENLEAEWIEPKDYPAKGNITKVEARINTNVTKAQLYITDLGWRDVKVKEGLISYKINEKLKKQRVRMILKIGNKVSTKILVKD